METPELGRQLEAGDGRESCIALVTMGKVRYDRTTILIVSNYGKRLS